MSTPQKISLGFLSGYIFLSSCIGFQVAGEIQQGRMQLIFGDPKLALAQFQRAAQTDPNYIMNFGVFQEGVWTYIGRANYATGKLPAARQALERARSHYDHDYLARLYLGLVLARDGDRQRGLSEIEGGMRGLYDWLEYITYNTSYGRFWDPGREIRSEIETNLAMISSKNIDWQKLIASGEWLGKRMEEEIDLARRDEERHQRRDGDGGD